MLGRKRNQVESLGRIDAETRGKQVSRQAFHVFGRRQEDLFPPGRPQFLKRRHVRFDHAGQPVGERDWKRQ